MEDEVVLFQKKEGVATVTLNRPDRLNAVNDGIRAGLREKLDDACKDDEVKVIIITGAGAGIGKACSEYFLKKDYNVALLGRNKDKLILDNKNDNCISIGCDIRKYSDVKNAFQKINAKWGRIDTLFNNAGIGKPSKTIDLISSDDWLDVVNTNLNGNFYCAKEAFFYMKNQQPQGGRIINNGSISAHVPRPGSAPYTSTKHAITGLTRSISLDGRKFNIACSQIDIGNAGTEMTK